MADPLDSSVVAPQPLRIAADERGVVFEPISDAEIAAQHNCHIVISKPGTVRGNHQHAKSTEITAITGPCEVRWREHGRLHDVQVPAGEVWRFVFPPGVSHAFRGSGSTPMIIASFSTQAHDPRQPDVSRDVLI
jgi:dTDP-4-dehydrorhamnose 3,5-epimerase-like enzyme